MSLGEAFHQVAEPHERRKALLKSLNDPPGKWHVDQPETPQDVAESAPRDAKPRYSSNANQFELQAQRVGDRLKTGKLRVAAIFQIANGTRIGNSGKLGNRIPG